MLSSASVDSVTFTYQAFTLSDGTLRRIGDQLCLIVTLAQKQMSGLALKSGEDTQALVLHTYDSECGAVGKRLLPERHAWQMRMVDDICLPLHTVVILLF